MSEEIDFPKPITSNCLDYTDVFVGLSPYEVKQWIKRCMEEFPNERESPFLYNTDGMVEWFEKWFDQFTVKCADLRREKDE